MKSFFVLAGFFSCNLCAHAPELPSGKRLSLSAGDNTTITNSRDIVILSRKPTCEASEIKLRPWNFDRADDVSDAFDCLNLCIEQSSCSGIFAMIEVADIKNKILFYEHSLIESLAQKKNSLASTLLITFQTFPLSLDVFRKARKYECKEVLPYLMQGWRFKYPASSPLDIMDEIVDSCVHFNEYQLLYAFLSVCPLVSAGTIKAFEDAVIAHNIPIGSAILQSGVLGWGSMYKRLFPEVAKFRQSMRAGASKLISKGSVLQLHERIDEIEVPFIIQMMAKSVCQPKSFVYLINRFGDSLFKFEALSIFKAACGSGHKDVFFHAFKVIHGLKYDLPLVYHALRSGARLDPVQTINFAVTLQYEPQRQEVANCLEVKLKDAQAPALLLKTWPEYMLMSEVFACFPKLIATGNKKTIMAAIGLCKMSHLFTCQRHVAYNLMGETNHRGLALTLRREIQQDPALLRAVLSVIDPRLFGSNGNESVEFYVVNREEKSVKAFLQNTQQIFQTRILNCMEHLRSITRSMNQNREIDGTLILMFIAQGGTWEELALMAAKNPGQEDLIRMAMDYKAANPFIVDLDRNTALLDIPNLSEEARNIIWRAQKRALAKNRKLALLWKVLPFKDPIMLIFEKYRQISIEAHRRIFNHNS